MTAKAFAAIADSFPMATMLVFKFKDGSDLPLDAEDIIEAGALDDDTYEIKYKANGQTRLEYLDVASLSRIRIYE